MSKNDRGIFIGLLVAGLGLLPGVPAAAFTPDAEGGMPLPAQWCSARSVEKTYTRADLDFERVRSQVNSLPAAEPWTPGQRHVKSAMAGVPTAAPWFRVSIEHAACTRLTGSMPDAIRQSEREALAKDCAEAGCKDPGPGLGAPNGSVMIIWSCANGVAREVEYEKVNGVWKVKSSRRELVVSCPLPKDPGGGGEPDPDPEPDKG